MIEAFRKNENQEIEASGIQGKEYDEIYRALTDIHQRMKEAKAMWDKNSERNKKKRSKKDERRRTSGRKQQKDLARQEKGRMKVRMMMKTQHLKREAEITKQKL